MVFGRADGTVPDGERARHFKFDASKPAVTLLGDESLTDYWTSRRNRAVGTNPKLTGPEYSGWRRQWDLVEAPQAGHRRVAQPPDAPLARSPG